MARDKLLTFVAPSNPHFKVATEKGWTHLTWMAVFSEGRRRQPERNNFEVGGHGGSHAWIYCSIGWLFFLKNPDWNEGHCHSLCQHYFFVRSGHWLTVGKRMQNIMAAIWITNWIKKTMVFVWQVQHFGMHAALLCGRRWALEVWWLCCVALPCNSHATHTQHTVNTTRNTSTFPVNSQSKCASCAKIWHLHLKTGFWVNPSKSARSLRIYRKSARVACCVDCVLRVCCMWVAWQGHATQPSYFQSPAPATQKSGMRPKVLHLPHKYHRFFYPICNSDCCHDILHPFSYCQPMSWAYEKVVLAETVTMPFVSVREDFLYHNIQQLRPSRTKLLNDDTKNLPRTETKGIVTVSASTTFSTVGKRMQNIMAAIWITNWIKKTMVFVWQVQHFGMHAALLCGRRWALEVWWLCCVALPCNSHATHTQHTVNTTRNTSTFPVNSQSKCASCAKIWHLHLKTGFWVNPSKSARSLRIYRKSARVACYVDCVLRVCCMWVAWQGHATQPSYFQSPAPATQKSGMRPKVLHLPHKYHRFFFIQFVIQIAAMIFCILFPTVSQCPERTKK